MYRQCNYIDLTGSLGLEYLELQVRAVAPWCHLCTRFILSFHRSIISVWILLSYFWLHSNKMAAPFPASICISQRKENRGEVEWSGGSSTKKAKTFHRKPQRIYRWPYLHRMTPLTAKGSEGVSILARHCPDKVMLLSGRKDLCDGHGALSYPCLQVIHFEAPFFPFIST